MCSCRWDESQSFRSQSKPASFIASTRSNIWERYHSMAICMWMWQPARRRRYSQPPGMARGCERVKEVGGHSFEIRTYKRNRCDWRRIEKHYRKKKIRRLQFVKWQPLAIQGVNVVASGGIFSEDYICPHRNNRYISSDERMRNTRVN